MALAPQLISSKLHSLFEAVWSNCGIQPGVSRCNVYVNLVEVFSPLITEWQCLHRPSEITHSAIGPPVGVGKPNVDREGEPALFQPTEEVQVPPLFC